MNVENFFCECGESFEEKEFKSHFKKFQKLFEKYKNFDFKISLLFKEYINSKESLIIIKFFLMRFMKFFDYKLKQLFKRNIPPSSESIIKNESQNIFTTSPSNLSFDVMKNILNKIINKNEKTYENINGKYAITLGEDNGNNKPQRNFVNDIENYNRKIKISIHTFPANNGNNKQESKLVNNHLENLDIQNTNTSYNFSRTISNNKMTKILDRFNNNKTNNNKEITIKFYYKNPYKRSYSEKGKKSAKGPNYFHKNQNS